MPAELAALSRPGVTIGQGTYRMGMGGLHSSEAELTYKSTPESVLIDRDVESYYPRIIINCGLAPAHLASAFLEVYSGLVERRVAAKRAKNAAASDGVLLTADEVARARAILISSGDAG